MRNANSTSEQLSAPNHSIPPNLRPSRTLFLYSSFATSFWGAIVARSLNRRFRPSNVRVPARTRVVCSVQLQGSSIFIWHYCLTSLIMASCPKLTDASIKAIVEICPALGCKNLTEVSGRAVAVHEADR